MYLSDSTPCILEQTLGQTSAMIWQRDKYNYLNQSGGSGRKLGLTELEGSQDDAPATWDSRDCREVQAPCTSLMYKVTIRAPRKQQRFTNQSRYLYARVCVQNIHRIVEMVVAAVLPNDSW